MKRGGESLILSWKALLVFPGKTKIRADLLGQLLEDTYKNQRIGPEFLSSLPISGIDGTLKKRMKISMKGKIRAKNWTLVRGDKSGRLSKCE